MPISPMDVVGGLAAPGAFGCAAWLLIPRLLPDDVARRHSATVAALGGFLIGYFLFALGPLAPNTHWHWLPYVTLAPLVLGPVSEVQGVTSGERGMLFLLAAIVAGWLLTPDWQDFQPSRPAYLVLWTALAVAACLLLRPLEQRMRGPLFPLVLTLTMASAAVVVFMSGSLRFAQITGAGTAALAGILAASALGGQARALDGVTLGFVILLNGTLLVAQVNSFSSTPLASYLLIPLAPLALWLCQAGPLRRLKGPKRWIACAGLPLLVCCAAVLLAVAAAR